MKSLRTILATAVLCTAVMAPVPASAQEIIHHVYMNRSNVRVFIHDVERESNGFRATFEKRYHNMFLSNFRRTDKARKAVQDLDKAIEMANRKAANQKPNYVRDDVQRVLDKARVVDKMFRDPDQVLATMKTDWADLKDSLNGLAGLYELPELDG